MGRGAQKDWTIRMMQFFDYYLKGTKETALDERGYSFKRTWIDQKYDLLEKINKMKKLLITAMALSCFAFSSYGQDKVEKQIIGKWCNPYTYKSTGELKGFEFKKGGKCSAINIPSLDLKNLED